MFGTRLAPLAAALLLAACGGGGGAGNAGGSTLPASATPPPVAQTLPDVAGSVVDDATGHPIAGAAVYVSGATVIAGATPPPATSAPWPSATTAADGSFDVKGVAPTTWTASFAYIGAGYPVYADAQWVDIFPADGHAAFHGLHSIAVTGQTNLGNVGIALPTASDVAWLNQINSDRVTLGVPPVATPLVFDSVTLQTARYWATQMESGNFYSHSCPAASTTCMPFWLFETQSGSVPSAQNIDEQSGAGSWQNAEAAFMAETVNCPNADWQTCPYSETTGHYINIMAASYWAGVGSAQTSAAPITQYYTENFATPADVSNIENIKRRL